MNENLLEALWPAYLRKEAIDRAEVDMVTALVRSAVTALQTHERQSSTSDAEVTLEVGRFRIGIQVSDAHSD